MNTEQIKAEAIARAAAALHAAATTRAIKETGRSTLGDWPDAPAFVRGVILERATAAVNALGELLPTGFETDMFKTTDAAKPFLRARRYVTDWTEVTE
ncbi:hypothetical protein [Nocardia sp. NPDC046763]|uniref:hypothetical protein n=1 Tax=Nocardia sp. NPDC046763 TaxID=3155256 RepID=UPI0033EB2C8C